MATNRGYRYGDGLFETMKMVEGNIALINFHFERLFAGLLMLKFEIPGLFTAEKLQKEIMQLCRKNECENLARIRLSIFRGNGGLYDDDKLLQYIIECWPLNQSVTQLNENGLVIDIYPAARKSCDQFSNLKSANSLPYSMAAQFAKENKLNDCLILNTVGNIVDSTVANIFIIKEGMLITPELDEGCINGVMRRYLLEKFRTSDIIFKESKLDINDLKTADEVFLTNAINGIRWVKQFKNIIYTNNHTARIYNQFVQTILP